MTGTGPWEVRWKGDPCHTFRVEFASEPDWAGEAGQGGDDKDGFNSEPEPGAVAQPGEGLWICFPLVRCPWQTWPGATGHPRSYALAESGCGTAGPLTLCQAALPMWSVGSKQVSGLRLISELQVLQPQFPWAVSQLST